MMEAGGHPILGETVKKAVEVLSWSLQGIGVSTEQ